MGEWTGVGSLSVRSNVRRKARRLCALFVSVALAVSPASQAAATLPTGGVIRYGEGAIGDPANGTLTVTQSGERMVIDWTTFSIGKENAVYFDQALGSRAIVLNRVLGGDMSEIYGRLQADGQVFLINPQGILFGDGARVDVGGLVASSLAISDDDFLAGRYRFAGGEVAGPVTNRGVIEAGASGEQGTSAERGGYVALLAPQVHNDGRISAHLGTVVLGAGGAAALELEGGGLLSFAIEEEAAGAYLANRGELLADGGVVWLEAKARDALLATVVNQEGTVRARGAQAREGRMVLYGGESGVVEVRGTLDASGTTGGAIDVTGERVALFGGSVVDATGETGGGRVRIGGGYQGQEEDIANARAVYAAEGARIDASALAEGDGGRVIVWSDESTRLYGSIAARGGERGGDGGFVETSGGVLTLSGQVDVSAPRGKAGAWLLDPYNITIVEAGEENVRGDGGVWESADDDGVVLASSLLAALREGSNVTVRTGAGGGQEGNITVAAPLLWETGAALTLEAHNNILIEKEITATAGPLVLKGQVQFCL